MRTAIEQCRAPRVKLGRVPCRALLHPTCDPSRVPGRILARTLACLLAATSTSHAAGRAGRAGLTHVRRGLASRLRERSGHVGARGGGHGIEQLQRAVELRHQRLAATAHLVSA